MERLVSADMQLHYSGIPVPAPDGPGSCLSESVAIRRFVAQKELHRLLMQHPTAANITVCPGTVRSVTASDDHASIRSVIVRKLDGTQITLNDIGLIAGKSFKVIQETGLS